MEIIDLCSRFTDLKFLTNMQWFYRYVKIFQMNLQILIVFCLHFRQSIDLYGSVPSPSIGFLGTPSLSRLSSSFLSTSLTRRHTPEVLSSLIKPFLPSVADEQPEPQRRSSHSLLPPIPRRSGIKKDQKPQKVSHELPVSRQSSFGQAVLNGMTNDSPLFPIFEIWYEIMM